MLEWAPGALGVAASLLRHFLDGPERRLRKQKLELEIASLSEAAQQRRPSDDADDFRRRVLDELRLLSAQIPEVRFTNNIIVGPTLIRTGSAEQAILRLTEAIEERRHSILMNAAIETPMPGPTEDSQDSSDPHLSSDTSLTPEIAIEWSEPSVSEISTEGVTVNERLQDLHARIEHRRKEDRT